MPTIKTPLGTRIELVNLDKRSSIPCRFVFQLTHELRPANILYGLSELVVLNHVLDLQTLDTYHLVFADNLSREFVLIIPSAVYNLLVKTCDLQTGFVSILRAFFLLGFPSLCFRNLLFILRKELRIAIRMPIARYHHAFYAQVKPDHLVDNWQGLNIFLDQQGHEVSVSTIFGDSYGGRFCIFGQRARSNNVEGFFLLGEDEDSFLPFECGESVFCGLLVTLFLPCRVLRVTFKEAEHTFVEVSQGLLRGDRRDLVQPIILNLLFEIGQCTGHLSIVPAFATLKVGIRSLSQCPIIHEANTPKSTSKVVFLLVGWVYSILVCSLLFHISHYNSYGVRSQEENLEKGERGVPPHVYKSGVSRHALLDEANLYRETGYSFYSSHISALLCSVTFTPI